FLALVLIFVYVGAVMTLFLFVVMMLNIDMASHRDGFVRSLLWGLIVMAVLVGLMLMALWPSNGMSGATVVESGNNIENLGLLLFSDYLYPFEVAGVILLVAIIAAISLAFYGRKPDTKTQSISKQHLVTKASRLRIIKMKGGSHD
ncbi:MAG TPA: NADH-quinone oxidoreductase subunit J, partial [Coxiellaceae bacterium]|nr:NADH-quinone oxidoreductase subunit J [Coxiellaceae bacterium]